MTLLAVRDTMAVAAGLSLAHRWDDDGTHHAFGRVVAAQRDRVARAAAARAVQVRRRRRDAACHLGHFDFRLAVQAVEETVLVTAERLKAEMAERAAVWFGPLTHYDDAAVAKHLKAGADAPLRDARERLAALQEWNVEAIGAALHATADALGLGMGKVAQPLRVAITGTQVSPDIAHTVYLAGRAEALKRIDAALERVPAAGAA